MMKILIPILLLSLTCGSNIKGQSNNLLIVDGDIYIYEYAMKKPNQANIGFIIINNYLIVQDICFTINFSKERMKNVYRKDQAIINTLKYSKKDGNILIENSGLLCYDSKNFIKRKHHLPDCIYKMIFSSFLGMSNKERLEFLNKISMSKDADSYKPK